MVSVLGLPCFAQSGSEVSSLLPTPDRKHDAQDGLGLRLSQTAIDPAYGRDDARGGAEALGAQCDHAKNLSPGYTIDPNAHGSLTGSVADRLVFT